MAFKMADTPEKFHIYLVSDTTETQTRCQIIGFWAHGFRFNHYLDAKMKICLDIFLFIEYNIFFNLHFDLLTVYLLYIFFSSERDIEMALCVICQDALGSNYVCVGDKGRRTLVAVSLEKQDGLHQLFQTKDPLQLHGPCRKAYTRGTRIKAEKRKASEAPIEEEAAPTKLRSRNPLFEKLLVLL